MKNPGFIVLRSPARWYCAVLLACQLVGCATTDRPASAQPPQVQIAEGLTLKLWSEPSPPRVGSNQIFLEVNAPTRNAMDKRDVLLSYQSAEGTKSIARMRPVPGKFDIFSALVEFDSAGKKTLTATVQSATQRPAIAHFQLPVIASDEAP
ncbi:MAG: hypothetical protein CV088_12360 [Nitrospira sp. LK70]|nr:hypothetical protein [Nitrospira sp. LK70]